MFELALRQQHRYYGYYYVWLFGLYTLPEADDVDSLLMGPTDLGLVSRLIGLPVVITGALSLRPYTPLYRTITRRTG